MGCAVRLVADYDEVIDQGVTRLHKDTTAFLLKMEKQAGTPAGEYANNTKFYDEAKVQIESLVLRAAATPKNTITTRQLKILADSFDELANAHEEQGTAGLNKETVAALRAPIDASFLAILKFEIAKKRNDSTGESSQQPEEGAGG